MLINPPTKQTFYIEDAIDANLERLLTLDQDIVIDQIFVGNLTETDINILVRNVRYGLNIWRAANAALAADAWFGNAVGFVQPGGSLIADDADELHSFQPIYCKRGDTIGYTIVMAVPNDFTLIITYHSFFPLENVWETV